LNDIYRPISILPHLGEIFKLIVYNNIKRSCNHVLIDEQHGFFHGKSTTTISVVFTTYISDCLESGYQVDVITTDFNKAFDTLNHNLLIDKLEGIGIGYLFLSWFKSYITGRKQFVSISGSSSGIYAVTSGVSQDGHLSALLFSLFGNSLPQWLTQVNILLYADNIIFFL